MQKSLFHEDTFVLEDYLTVAGIAFSASLVVLTVGRNVFPEDNKKLSYCISVMSSATMTMLGFYYYLVKVPTLNNFFFFGGLDEDRFHQRDNFGCALCTMFGVVLVCDLAFGIIFYPKQMDFLTAYFHHSLYIYFMYFAITGDGYFFHSKPWTSCFLFFLPAELPTFLLGLGTIVPKFRNDLLFGITFFCTRIVMHIYLLTYSYMSQTAPIVLIFGVLTLLMHLQWFYGWFTKYGIYYITGKKKKGKGE